MKTFTKGLIVLSMFLINTELIAQALPVREPDMNRPTLFQDLPEKINCRVNDLTAFLQSEIGSTVSFNFSGSVNFQGVVSSVASKFANTLQTVVIRSTNLPGAALSFSKLIKEDGSVSYIGRIISFQHGDAYEIVLQDGQYFFVKKHFYDLVNE